MKQRCAEITIKQEKLGWQVVDCSKEFLEMTGFAEDDLAKRFQNQFMQMFSAADIPAAEELLSLSYSGEAMYPWIFTLASAKSRGAAPVFLQLLSENQKDCPLRIQVHDASFLDEQAVRMSRRIQSLEDSIPSGLCQVLFNEKFTIIWHNKIFLEMLGYTQEQFTEERKSEAAGYIHPEDYDAITRILSQAVVGQEPMATSELRIIRRDGEQRTFLAAMSFTGETVNGAPVFYSTQIDITERKRAQQLELDAERLRIAMEQTASCVLEYNVADHTILASESLMNCFGISGNAENVPESLLQKNVISAASEDTFRLLFQKIDQGEQQAEGVVCLGGNGGLKSEHWFRLRITTIFCQGHRPVKAIILAEDITDRYETEMRYREEEKRRAAMTYDMSFSFQFDLTTERILSVNEEKFAYFDWKKAVSSRELILKNAGQYVHPDDRGEYLKKLSTQYMLEQLQGGIPEITIEFRAQGEDQQYRWTRGIAHVIREPEYGHIYAYIYTKDIEEEKSRELELRRHAEQDALTGLYNRYTTELRCDKSLKELYQMGLAAMYLLDLDNFKHLNDTCGHLRGDEILRLLADCLRDIFGRGILLGRIGGDEFIAFQPECPSEERACEYAREIGEAFERLQQGEEIVTVSVGLAFSPKHGKTFADLYHCADDALYRAKRGGKNGCMVYQKSSETEQQKSQLTVRPDWLLEESSDIIYVCDFYNYDLLYMNLGARQAFGLENESYIGKKCYELLQKKEQPCECCTNHLLCREDFYCWEFRNSLLGKSFLLKDRIVDWYGVTARIEFATDISGIDQRNQALTEQVEIDNVIISCLRMINGAGSLEAGAEPIMKRLAEFYQAERVFILEYDVERNMIFPQFEWERPKMRTLKQIIGGDGLVLSGPIKKCLEEHKNYLYDRTEGPSDAMLPIFKLLYDAGVTCQRGVPFYIGGKPAGMIGLDNPAVFRDELSILETLAYFISEELSRNKLQESLTFLGYHDSLTGLWNRNRYVKYMEELAAKELNSLGVVIADINALKDINKMRGHMQGDTVVRQAARLLQDSFPGAEIFRLSGDEFVVHSENQVREEFFEQVEGARSEAGKQLVYGIAIGGAWGDQEIDYSMLNMQATDIMMMKKREYYQHEKEYIASGKHHHDSLHSLIEHIEAGHFKMYLQPKADCESFRLSGAEALVRFESEEYGLVPPDRFIALLEQEHLIQYIDLFIFEEVCKLLARWQKEGCQLLPVSLNFSRQTVLEPALLKTLLQMTERYGVPKDYIEVEVTESLGEYESATIGEIGGGIKTAGFRLALDDFGSQYTNMAMLSVVPVDVLKIDRGMVRNVMHSQSNQMILKAILALCREMGISSIAEGVETEEQLELLKGLNCDAIQGYLFGRPIPVQHFEEKYMQKL